MKCPIALSKPLLLALFTLSIFLYGATPLLTDEEKEQDPFVLKVKNTNEKKNEQQIAVDLAKLQQVSIEAKIVEANEDFVRSIGVRFGGSVSGSGGSSSKLLMGTNPSTNRAISVSYPDGLAFIDAATGKPFTLAPVNFPSALASPTLGFVIGGAQAILEAQLQALETNSQGKIISSPRITTLDNVRAVISQGEEVPYVVPGTSTTPSSIKFKQALLKLEVKPSIIAEDRIALEVLATNDWPDYSKATAYTNYVPPISTSRIESKVIVNDGDTLVIGGIKKNRDMLGVSGVPFLQNIPLIGWLFKGEDVSTSQKQLLVFVTPRIIRDRKHKEEVTEHNKGTEQQEVISNKKSTSPLKKKTFL